MLQFDYGLKSQEEISNLFGKSFAASLTRAPMDEWSGPITSAYGVHLVRVIARRDSYLPPIAEVREEILDAYMTDASAALEDDLYRDLRSRYRVVLPSDTKGAP